MRHIVALSGGKDSSAMALRLAELHPETEYEYVCTPTGDELPEMEAHWSHLETLLHRPLVRLVAGTLGGLIVSQNALPNHRQRWCTRILKIEPFIAYMLSAAPAVSYVGLRADEESRTGAVYGAVDGITPSFPMQEWGWSVGDVWEYLESRAVSIPQRTDCFDCFWQTIPEWYLLWKQHPDKYAQAEAREAFVTERRGKPTTFRSDSRDTWPAGLTALREEFERGRLPRGLDKWLQLKTNVGDRPQMCRACKL